MSEVLGDYFSCRSQIFEENRKYVRNNGEILTNSDIVDLMVERHRELSAIDPDANKVESVLAVIRELIPSGEERAPEMLTEESVDLLGNGRPGLFASISCLKRLSQSSLYSFFLMQGPIADIYPLEEGKCFSPYRSAAARLMVYEGEEALEKLAEEA